MIHMRQPFQSIASATIFLLFALIFGFSASTSSTITLAGASISDSVAWAISGLSFLMAYFELVHLKYK